MISHSTKGKIINQRGQGISISNQGGISSQRGHWISISNQGGISRQRGHGNSISNQGGISRQRGHGISISNQGLPIVTKGKTPIRGISRQYSHRGKVVVIRRLHIRDERRIFTWEGPSSSRGIRTRRIQHTRGIQTRGIQTRHTTRDRKVEVTSNIITVGIQANTSTNCDRAIREVLEGVPASNIRVWVQTSTNNTNDSRTPAVRQDQLIVVGDLCRRDSSRSDTQDVVLEITSDPITNKLPN
jgi:hypothetical protein